MGEKVRTPEEIQKEVDYRYLWKLKDSVEGLVYWINALHPDFLQTAEPLKELLKWTPEYFDATEFKKSEGYEEGDEQAPFFSEAFLYNLLGKEDARTLLSLMKRALGIKGIGKL